MASLKEIKSRINSVNGTLKITSAMKMVASSKLRKAQQAIGNLLPYERQMHGILADLMAGEVSAGDRYVEERPVKRVAIVAFSSNSSLCGAFNSIAVKHLSEAVARYREQGLSGSDILVFPVGRKIADAVRKMGLQPQGDYSGMADKPSYADTSALAQKLMDMFVGREVDKIELIYNHCKSTSTQVPTCETYLPVSLDAQEYRDADPETDTGEAAFDYIVEPDAAGVLDVLLPKVLYLKIYAVLLDACAAEHSARTVAMQVATDNGQELLQELTVQYNKQRQQAITDELLDIVGGTMA